MPIIWWLRRDIRLDDNLALAEAHRQAQGAVVPVFVLDRRILDAPDTGAARVHFLMDSLRHLDAELRERGGRLIVREGEPVVVLRELCAELGAEALVFNRDYEPYARERDTAVTAALNAAGVRVESFKDRLIFEPDELLTSNGTPFTVYTPYRRRWLARIEEDPALSARHNSATLQFAPVADLAKLPVPDGRSLGFATEQALPEAGAAAANALLQSFARRGPSGLRSYHHNRNRLDVDGTSRLAPHLRHGTLSPRAAVRAAVSLRERAKDPDERKACETWLGELAWRDFYTAIMYSFPHVLDRPYRDLFVDFPYRDAPDELTAWERGATGYPVVDAALRQLNTTGFMHNRARLISASFLIKDLLIDYRRGERYFLRQLACGDHAINNGNWQWVAGSSNDPQPYFRIFNPVTQGTTYDPDGVYLRRFVPELAALPSKYIHAPWTLPAAEGERLGFKLGRDYPAPIVDHKAARERARVAFKQLRDAFYGAQAESAESD